MEEDKDQKSGKDKTDLSIFINDYLRDAKEGIQEANSALLALEKDHSQTHSQTGLLDVVFRAVHTLKSSSVMLEFTDIAELAHITEDLLDRMRKGEVAVVNETIDPESTIKIRHFPGSNIFAEILALISINRRRMGS